MFLQDRQTKTAEAVPVFLPIEEGTPNFFPELGKGFFGEQTYSLEKQGDWFTVAL